jgi:hypothetical protein
MDANLEAQLRILLDKQAIHELINAYFSAADRHDHARMRALYHEDALDDHGHFFKGLAMDFIDKLPQIQAGMAILHHNCTTVNLKLDGERAEGEVYALAFHTAKNAGAGLDVLIGARYFDKYEKRAGVWKFSHRAIVADWAWVNDPSRVQLDHPFLAGARIGCPGPADPSYAFFSMLKRGER